MNQSVTKRIGDLRLTAKSRIDQIQIECAPFLADRLIRIEERYSYIFKGYEESVHDYSFRVFKVDGLRFMNHMKSTKKFARRDYVKNMVDDKIVYPFLLFNHGAVVKWSKIEILKDYNYTYLFVHDMDLEPTDMHIVEFPCEVRYGEDDDILDTTQYPLHFYFDVEGKITSGDVIECRLEVTDPDIYGELVSMSNDKPYIEIKTEYGQLASKDCIIPFYKGLLSPTTLNDLTHMGWNIYKSDTGKYDKYVYAVFYYKNGNLSSGIMYKDTVNYEGIRNVIIQSIHDNAKSYISELFSKDFEFSYTNQTSYEENLKNSLRYITGYNASLMDKTYEDTTGVYTAQYTGKDFISMASNYHDSNSKVVISRRKHSKLDSYVLVFLNGGLYKYQNYISYDTNSISIPIQDIKETDTVEIMYFTNVCNDIATVTMIEGEDKYISDDIYDIDYVKFYTQEPPELDYKCVELDSSRATEQFEIGYAYADKGNGNYRFTMNHDFYNKPLTCASERQFRYTRLTSYNFDEDDYYFKLPSQFAFCHDKDRYLVFINNIMMSKQNFTVTAMSERRPFEELYLYVTTRMEPDDVVDIYYVPDKIQDMVYIDKLELTGDIVIDAGELDTPLSNETYFIFVNGLKVLPDQLINVSRNKMRVKTDLGSIHNVRICRFTDPLEDLVKFYTNSSTDEWTDYVESLTQDQKNELMGCNLNNLPSGDDYMKDHYALDAVVNDIVVDYYIKRAGVTMQNSVFVYDFEVDAVDTSPDDTSNIIAINTLDPNREKIHQYVTNPATEEDKNNVYYKGPFDPGTVK